MWNNEILKRLFKLNSFEARLIPLNKAWPSIPEEDQFRPIVVTSAIIKWIEIRFLPKLKNYLKHDLDKY